MGEWSDKPRVSFELDLEAIANDKHSGGRPWVRTAAHELRRSGEGIRRSAHSLVAEAHKSQKADTFYSELQFRTVRAPLQDGKVGQGG